MANVLLRRGDGASTGFKEQVEGLQTKLWDNGLVGEDSAFWGYALRKYGIKGPDDPRAKTKWIDGDYGGWTEESVMYAQHQLVGQRGIPLDEIVKLGVCDLDTWDALDDPERSQPDVPDHADKADHALGETIVQAWDYYIGLKLVETPSGSNSGPDVKPFWFGAKGAGISYWTWGKKWAWCCLARCAIEREAHGVVYGEGKYVHSDTRMGLCYGNYKWGLKQDENPLLSFIDGDILRGWVVDKKDVLSGKVLLPVGSAAIMHYGGTRGHTFTVAGILYDKDGKPEYILSREGNISNKADKRKRRIDQATLKWFIVSPLLFVDANFVGDRGVATFSGDGERTR